ncbi:MAG: tyrosine-type recombinase/integrase [Haloechinothrix sp.]
MTAKAGTAATLHALRHTAAYRMAQDPALPPTDVQFVLGHAQLTTTQIYLTPREEEVIRRVLTHHAEQVRQAGPGSRLARRPGTGLRPIGIGAARYIRWPARRSWRRTPAANADVCAG